MTEKTRVKRTSLLTRTSRFGKLAKWAFRQCDRDKAGKVGKDELYAGILLVHLNLAKYAGPAACYPPSREVVDSMFDHADDDKSGTIDEAEFTKILMICCVDITSRMVTYYSIIILLVPYVTKYCVAILLHFDEWLGWNVSKTEMSIFRWIEMILTWNQIAEKIVSFSLFVLVIPLLFEYIDSNSRRVAKSTFSTPSQSMDISVDKKKE